MVFLKTKESGFLKQHSEQIVSHFLRFHESFHFFQLSDISNEMISSKGKDSKIPILPFSGNESSSNKMMKSVKHAVSDMPKT